jgi:hypothetical protein
MAGYSAWRAFTRSGPPDDLARAVVTAQGIWPDDLMVYDLWYVGHDVLDSLLLHNDVPEPAT